MTRVCAVQLDVSSSESPDDRIERAFRLIAEVAQGGAELVVLPELWPTGGFDLPLGLTRAQPLDGPLVGALARAAREHGIWLHGGSFVEAGPDGRFHNTAVLCSPDGRLAGVYRKIHLFGFDSGEAELLTAGTSPVVVPTPLGRTALATCYDLRFPELFRRFVDEGAEAVLITSAWPAARSSQWSVLVRARAIENQLPVVACNQIGIQGSDRVRLGGRSLVCDARGEILAEADTDERLLFAELDPNQAAAVRVEFPVLRDRRLG